MATTTNWKFDLSHSELGFKIRHLMISNVSGTFKNFDLSVQTTGNDFTTAQISARVDMTSIFTNNEQRDAHLLNSDFFEVEQYPEMLFQSASVKAMDDDNYELNGDLTIRGITKPVKLKIEYNGLAK